MLEEAGKILSSAFNNSFVKKLSLYLHDCVREEVQSSTFRNLKQDKDNKWIFLDVQKTDKSKPASILDGERLFTSFPEPLKLDGSDPYLNELMIQGKCGQKDKYLIYGYLFLAGKNTKTKRNNEFLTPLLYAACSLERNGVNIECSLQEEGLSLNTAAITSLMNVQSEEDEIESMLDGLLEAAPKLPLKEEDLNIFLSALKALIPDLDINLYEDAQLENSMGNVTDYRETPKVSFENADEAAEETEAAKTKTALKADKVVLANKSAIILTKRPLVTAGVLYELAKIAETPSGTLRETALNVINEEFLQGQGKMPSAVIKENTDADFVPITPLSLSDAQENVIKNLDNNTILAVYGPPGTGKSQTIVNLICHLVSNGRTVLVSSKMDKAADVIADRLNSFDAPFLALRAGRANYQKELSNELQNLMSGKIDLDNGFEDTLTASPDDMKKLAAKIKEKENACNELIKLEEEWQKYSKQIEASNGHQSASAFLDSSYSISDINNIEAAVKNLEKYISREGFFAKIAAFFFKMQLKMLIKKKGFTPDMQALEQINQELESAKLSAHLREIESSMAKYGSINNLIAGIKELRKKQGALAVNILKGSRRNSLKGLLRDQVKRQRLYIHTKALTARKQNLQSRLLEDEDFKPLLEAFPCWCVTSYAVSNSLPLKPALFDVGIIDEASQCDIAGCIPILYRCRKVVIVGDDKQLPHLSFLEKSKEQSFLSQYEIPDKYQLIWRFRTNSMFDLANYYSMTPVLLDEHFRSPKPLIDFSIQNFYGGKINVMVHSDDKKVLELVRVKDGRADSDVTRNMPETEALMQRLQELINEDNEKQPEKPVSIGIISPFRGQVELIKKALSQLYPDSVLRRHKIEAGTAHTFQGDERDIMMLSFAIADNSFNQSLTFLQLPNLFNVAITRAKKKQIVFLSKDPKSLPAGLLKDYIEYIQRYEAEENSGFSGIGNFYKNVLEKEIAEALRAEGFDVRAGEDIAGVSADLLVKDEAGRKIIIECDGLEDSEKSRITQIKKQQILEKTGLMVERMSYREWKLSSKGCILRIKDIFAGG